MLLGISPVSLTCVNIENFILVNNTLRSIFSSNFRYGIRFRLILTLIFLPSMLCFYPCLILTPVVPTQSHLTEDAISPFFFHLGKNPNVVLVTHPLTSENYNSWSRSMTMALLAKNRLGFINGTLLKPSNPTHLMLAPWMRCNNMVNSWILNSVSSKIA